MMVQQASCLAALALCALANSAAAVSVRQRSEVVEVVEAVEAPYCPGGEFCDDPPAAPKSWERIGPFNIFDDKDLQGEAGTLANAASPAANHDLIYAGGHNNGVSSGILRTYTGTSAVPTWTRQSKGLWDTRIYGVWIHPSDANGGHVLVGTGTGIYESKDYAETWTFRKETEGWGTVMSFREGVIGGVKYVFANTQDGIGTQPLAGGAWQKVKAPGDIAPNSYISLVTTKGKTEVLTCIGGWGGGQLYYGAFDSPTSVTWEGPISANGVGPNGEKGEIDCANAAVDPNDRNHFLYSRGEGHYDPNTEYKAWHSEDGGKTVAEYTDHATGVYFVMIDQKGWMYTATQEGAYVTEDKGATWNAYHVIMHSRTDDKLIDRVPHDYQNIVPEFRGDGVAFPSDQGLHIVNRSSYTLTSAVGDLHNTMSLSALISPSTTFPGSRTIVSNIWDWDVMFSENDGKAWQGWKDGLKSPANCGEGGSGVALGKSGYVIIFHGNRYWHSSDGGYNFVEVSTKAAVGAVDGGFAYVRKAGSRTEPSGVVFTLMRAPAPPKASRARRGQESRVYRPDAAEGGEEDEGRNEDEREEHERREEKEEREREMNPEKSGYTYHPGVVDNGAGAMLLGTSQDFGLSWNFLPMPAKLPASDLVVDPTNPNSLYAMTPNCLAHSTDSGATWSDCSKATGLSGGFSKLIVKDATTMFMLRRGDVPLRTQDGGKSWQGLSATASLFKYGATLDASLSWTGNTLVLHGNDISAIGRGEYGTVVWKTSDDGDTWDDETGDLVTISPDHGVWYESDFYFVTRGEGITVKRNFE